MKIHLFAATLMFLSTWVAATSLANAETPMTIYGTFDRVGEKPATAEPEGSQFHKGLALPTQSSINLYGTIDAGMRHLSNVNAAGDDTWKMGSNGEYYNNRIGIKGVEDLGNGLNTHFHLEAGFNSGTGALDNNDGRLFNRISSLGFAGAFGSLDLGRQPSVACKAVYSYEPFQYRYVHVIPLAGAVAGNIDGRANPLYGTVDGPRFSNGVQYFGKFGRFTVSTEYIFGEKQGDADNGAGKALGLVYKSGGLAIGGAYTTQKPNLAASGSAANYQDQDQITYGAAYKSGAWRVAGGYMRTDTDTASAAIAYKTGNIWVGGSYDFNPVFSLTAGYYRTTVDTSTRQMAQRDLAIVGATYALSKRTSLYAAIDHAELSGAASLAVGGQTSQLGISAGVNHAF